MADDELRLNSLDRFRKRSPKLVLEEHSHCEVPAGCGGVVLRWRDSGAIPFRMWLATPGREAQAWIDGEVSQSAVPTLVPGVHVLALQVAVAPGGGVLVFAGTTDPEETEAQPSHLHTTVCSAPDGSWSYSLTPPEDGAWLRPGFAGWPALEAFEFAAAETERWPCRPALDHGGVGLGVPAADLARPLGLLARALGTERPQPTVWVRKEFEIQRREDS